MNPTNNHYGHLFKHFEDEHELILTDSELNEIELICKKMAWQPIETAPNDGTHVLVHISKDVFLAYMDADGEWWGAYDHELVVDGPTHWMPLPEPPTQ